MAHYTCPVCSVTSLLMRYIRKNLKGKQNTTNVMFSAKKGNKSTILPKLNFDAIVSLTLGFDLTDTLVINSTIMFIGYCTIEIQWYPVKLKRYAYFNHSGSWYFIPIMASQHSLVTWHAFNLSLRHHTPRLLAEQTQNGRNFWSFKVKIWLVGFYGKQNSCDVKKLSW